MPGSCVSTLSGRAWSARPSCLRWVRRQCHSPSWSTSSSCSFSRSWSTWSPCRPKIGHWCMVGTGGAILGLVALLFHTGISFEVADNYHRLLHGQYGPTTTETGRARLAQASASWPNAGPNCAQALFAGRDCCFYSRGSAGSVAPQQTSLEVGVASTCHCQDAGASTILVVLHLQSIEKQNGSVLPQVCRRQDRHLYRELQHLLRPLLGGKAWIAGQNSRRPHLVGDGVASAGCAAGFGMGTGVEVGGGGTPAMKAEAGLHLGPFLDPRSSCPCPCLPPCFCRAM